MKDMSVPYTIGNEVKQLEIKFMANGIGHITVGAWFHGQAVYAQNEWRVYLNDKCELNNSDDIQNMVQILNEQMLSS